MWKDTNPHSKAHLIVGRAAEVEYLEQCLEAALGGERQVVFVSGEPGIGKTTIVESFLERLRLRNDVRVGHGQCIEQYGAGEAFMPLLEIAGQLCHGPEKDYAESLLREYAPSWLIQLPFLIDVREFETLQRQLQGSTRERMLREAAEVLTRFTHQQGLALVFEDLHWSDVSTLEWLSYIAQHRNPAKLLIIGTYRPTDVLVSGHPLRGVVQELTVRGCCEELRVRPLEEPVIAAYIRERFSETAARPELVHLIYRRTGGNPLFMVNLTDYLLHQGVVQEEAGRWRVHGDLSKATAGVPESLRQIIERQLERLPEDAQRLLEAASVVGVEFSAAAVAAGLQVGVEEIDCQCEVLARKGQFIRAQGTEEWPDGTLSERYVFLHALYHAVLSERVTETQRVRLHRRIGERKEAAYGERAGEIAAELAVHFEGGRDLPRAVTYLQRAGEIALQRYANQEAIRSLKKGLALLETLPDLPESSRQELSLQVALGPALIAIKGYAAAEVEQTYLRARELCQQFVEPGTIFPVLFGLWNYYITRAELQPTRELADQMLSLARRFDDSALLLQAHRALTETFFWVGEFPLAREHGEQGIALYDPRQHQTHAVLYAEEPGAYCCAITAWVLWFLGYPEQAVKRSAEALVLARQGAHPFSEAMALTLSTQMLQLRGEIEAARRRAEEGIALAAAQGFPFWETWVTIEHGWVRAELGEGEEGISQIHQALAAYPAVEFRTWNLALLAEAYGKTELPDEGLRVLKEALAMVEQTGERFYEAEVYRLQGELTLQSKVESQKSKEEQAEACFLNAIEVARRQQAKALELRAAVSLARLWQAQGKQSTARDLLAEIYHWFTEGFDTRDLQAAAALLRSLGGEVKRAGSKRQATGVGRPTLREVQSAKRKAQHAGPSLDSQLPISNTQHSTLSPQPPNIFRREGDYWTLAFTGEVRRIRHTLGMQYLAQLLRQPHHEFPVLALVTGGTEQTESMMAAAPLSNSAQIHHGLSDAGEMLDAQARDTYKRRLRELRAELEETQSFHDIGRTEKIQAEIDFLTAEISRAVGLGRRTRKAASSVERARVNVTLAIKTALKRITTHHPAMGQYLTQTIKTGYSCTYTPDRHRPVVWQF